PVGPGIAPGHYLRHQPSPWRRRRLARDLPPHLKGPPAMPSATATARVATSRAARYLAHLCEHTSKLSQHTSLTHGHDRAGPLPQQAQWSGTDGVIDFGNGRCTLHATSEALEIRAEAADTQLLLRIQDA